MKIKNIEVVSYAIAPEDCDSYDFGITYLKYEKAITLDFYIYRIHFTWGGGFYGHF